MRASVSLEPGQRVGVCQVACFQLRQTSSGKLYGIGLSTHHLRYSFPCCQSRLSKHGPDGGPVSVCRRSFVRPDTLKRHAIRLTLDEDEIADDSKGRESNSSATQRDLSTEVSTKLGPRGRRELARSWQGRAGGRHPQHLRVSVWLLLLADSIGRRRVHHVVVVHDCSLTGGVRVAGGIKRRRRRWWKREDHDDCPARASIGLLVVSRFPPHGPRGQPPLGPPFES